MEYSDRLHYWTVFFFSSDCLGKNGEIFWPHTNFMLQVGDILSSTQSDSFREINIMGCNIVWATNPCPFISRDHRSYIALRRNANGFVFKTVKTRWNISLPDITIIKRILSRDATVHHRTQRIWLFLRVLTWMIQMVRIHWKILDFDFMEARMWKLQIINYYKR